MEKTLGKIRVLNNGGMHVNFVRKTTHSATNKVMATRGGVGRAAQALDYSANSAGVAATVGAVGGAIAIISSPVFGAVAGGMAIVSLAISAYSNRESAHKKLRPYVYSYIDRNPPALNVFADDNAKAAAMSLIMDGYAQRKLQDGKLKRAVNKYNAWLKIYSEHRSNPAKNEDRLKLVNEAFRRDGEIFELVRRLNHRANYLQAFAVVAQVFSGDTKMLPDLSTYRDSEAEIWRTEFARLAAMIDHDNRGL